MPLPHEEDEQSPGPLTSTVLPDPREVTGRANDAAELVDALKAAIIALQASQEAQGRAVAAVGALLVRGVNLASDPSDPQHSQMQRVAALMSEWAPDIPDSTAPQHVLVDQLEAFKQNNAPAASVRAVAYEAVFKEHAQAQSKLQGKPEKRKVQALAQTERAAQSRAAAAAQLADAQWDICRRDLNTTMANAARAVGAAQMSMHALALEGFTRLLEQLPGAHE